MRHSRLQRRGLHARGHQGIYNHNVRREVLGSSSIKDKSVNELIRFVEAKEAACDAAVGGRPVATAAPSSSSYKKSSRQDSSSR